MHIPFEMKKSILALSCFVLLLFSSCKSQPSPAIVPEEPYTPTPENLAARQAFDADRFGIFIHWGIYSMLGQGEWVQQVKDLNYKEYAHLADGFCPSKFDATQWVKAIKGSGAKYITITSRHHDGFSMFHSKATDFNVVDATPFGRDVLAELAKACAKEGIRLHFYYSHLDWGRPDYYPLGRTGHGTGRPEPDCSDSLNTPWKHYLDFMDVQLTELLTNYGPIGAIWFDGIWDKDDQPREAQPEIWNLRHQYDLIHRLQPACLVGNNHHLLPFEGEDIQIFERDVPGENSYGLSGQEISRLPLETCQTMNWSWGYRVTDKDYKSADDLIRYLVSTAAKGANLLLNIGPRPDGTLPDEAIERLEAMGRWLAVYGESIYGTQAGPVKDVEWGYSTAKDNVVYLHITDAQKLKKIELATAPVSASLLSDGTAVAYTYKNGKLNITLPELSEVDIVVKLTMPDDSKTAEYVDWLYENMSLADSLNYDRDYWTANVSKTLEVRERMGWNIPEREFRHFVLPLRANNEILDDFRTVYADTLCARVAGMSLQEAAIEINHWCHEQATYQPSDARTSAPMATVRRGLGRCGEESVLGVAALRAAGIPARQVYTPRWAHTDDNHAWVEVWVDGKWHFMGACEPEPKLDMAWFNAPVSRAMLLHTKVFGNYEGDEDVISQTSAYTEINVIRGYVNARRTAVTVVDSKGRKVADATVGFKIYNYAEYYPVAWYKTDRKGRTALNTGCGDVFIWAVKDDMFGFGVASSENTKIVLNHRFGEVFSADVDLVPPVENPIPSSASEEEIARNAERFAAEDLIRAAHDHSNPAIFKLATRSDRLSPALLGGLCVKDRTDITEAVVEDVLANTASTDPFVLSPRIAYENLLPIRREVLASGLGERLGLDKLGSVDARAEALRTWVRDSIRIVEGRNPQHLAIPPRSVWRSKTADESARNMLFVALCRTYAIPARIDEVTGNTQYRRGSQWVDVKFDEGVEEIATDSPKGTLKLYTDCPRTPLYYRHFTIARINGDGRDRLLEFGTDADTTPVSEFADGVELEPGCYMLTTGSRMADGSVLSHVEFFNIVAGETVTLPVVMRESDTEVAVLGSMDPEAIYQTDSGERKSILSTTGRGYFLLAVLGEKDEPSVHASLDLQSIASDLEAWGRPALILGRENDPDGSIVTMLTNGCESTSTTLPVVTICDSFGRIVYFSQGYNTSLAVDLQRVISKLK